MKSKAAAKEKKDSEKGKKESEKEKKESEKEKKESEKEKEEIAKGDGPLKGKLVRVVDETNMFCGRVLEVLGHAKGKLHAEVAWKDALSSYLDKSKVPAKVTIDETRVLLLEQIKQPELHSWKSLRFKDEERVEAETLFLPEELEKGYKLGKDASLPLIHMEMWLWLMARDFELKVVERIKLLNPSKMAYICQQMQLPDAAERFVDEVGTLGATLKDAKLILLPVWGDDPEHWTLLIVSQSEEGKWNTRYKDSLSGFHKGCAENASKLTTLLSASLMTDLQFPKDRCNLKMQPKGSLECGFFVCHWVEQEMSWAKAPLRLDGQMLAEFSTGWTIVPKASFATKVGQHFTNRKQRKLKKPWKRGKPKRRKWWQRS